MKEKCLVYLDSYQWRHTLVLKLLKDLNIEKSYFLSLYSFEKEEKEVDAIIQNLPFPLFLIGNWATQETLETLNFQKEKIFFLPHSTNLWELRKEILGFLEENLKL